MVHRLSIEITLPFISRKRKHTSTNTLQKQNNSLSLGFYEWCLCCSISLCNHGFTMVTPCHPYMGRVAQRERCRWYDDNCMVLHSISLSHGNKLVGYRRYRKIETYHLRKTLYIYHISLNNGRPRVLTYQGGK